MCGGVSEKTEDKFSRKNEEDFPGKWQRKKKLCFYGMGVTRVLSGVYASKISLTLSFSFSPFSFIKGSALKVRS